MTLQGAVEAATHGGADTSLLEHQLDGQLALSDSLRTSTRVHLAVIPSTDESLWDLGAFTFVASCLFSAGGRHLSSVAYILRITEILEELHTEV